MTDVENLVTDRPFDLTEFAAGGSTLTDLLSRAVESDPERVYAVDWTGTTTTLGELSVYADALAAELASAGIGPSSRVASALPNSVGHIAIVFALVKLDAVWIPLNVKLRGDALDHQLRDSGATHLIAEPTGTLVPALERSGASVEVVHPAITGLESTALPSTANVWMLQDRESASQLEPPSAGTVALMYTSGTTGPAKAVQVSNVMLAGAAVGAIEAADPRDGDVFYVWEPLIHIGGAQLMLLPLITRTHLAIAAGLSISRFWDDVRAFDATHIHHLGGVLQMLLSRPASAAERNHKVRISWGAGATADIWDEVQHRFGVAIHECYGSTELSSVTTVNKSGPRAGIGRPLPWFETTVAPGNSDTEGELLVRPTIPGLVTAGYLNRAAATQQARLGDWWRTGDVVRFDRSDNFHFVGRVNDSVRIHGENVSAWQVESVLSRHPAVDRCAAVGVDGQVGEQDILLYVVLADGQSLDPEAFAHWARERMPEFHIPRYLRVVDGLPVTASLRVIKRELSTDPAGTVDLAQFRRR